VVDRSGRRQSFSCHAAWVEISPDIEHTCYGKILPDKDVIEMFDSGDLLSKLLCVQLL
jgi:hypothetical protein